MKASVYQTIANGLLLMASCRSAHTPPATSQAHGVHCCPSAQVHTYAAPASGSPLTPSCHSLRTAAVTSTEAGERVQECYCKLIYIGAIELPVSSSVKPVEGFSRFFTTAIELLLMKQRGRLILRKCFCDLWDLNTCPFWGLQIHSDFDPQYESQRLHAHTPGDTYILLKRV